MNFIKYLFFEIKIDPAFFPISIAFFCMVLGRLLIMIFRGYITPLDIDAIFVYIAFYSFSILLLIIKYILKKFTRKNNTQ